jgi:hypothetical protein
MWQHNPHYDWHHWHPKKKDWDRDKKWDDGKWEKKGDWSGPPKKKWED